jgi:hypothetical protein
MVERYWQESRPLDIALQEFADPAHGCRAEKDLEEDAHVLRRLRPLARGWQRTRPFLCEVLQGSINYFRSAQFADFGSIWGREWGHEPGSPWSGVAIAASGAEATGVRWRPS